MQVEPVLAEHGGICFYDMAKFDGSNGFCVHGWMVTELHLDGAELLAFAIVHQFTQGFSGKYTGNTAYLCAWTGWTEKTARKHLAALVEKGFIVEERGRKDNKPFCHYSLAPYFYEKHPVKITASPGKIFPSGPVKISVSPGKNYPHNNNNNDKEVNIIPPTPQEVVDYCREQGFRDPIGFADYYLRCQTANQWRKKSGEPIVNWKLNIQQWRKYHKDDTFPHPDSEQFTASNDQINAYLR